MKILEAQFIMSVNNYRERKQFDIGEVCFIGRSNVGKSSAINALVNRKIARISSTPGATRMINLYKVHYEYEAKKDWLIFSDFPGFGYSKVSKGTYEGWMDSVERYIQENIHIKRLIWIFDVRRDPDRLDDMLVQWMTYIRIGFTVVLTKVDKETRNNRGRKRDIFEKYVKNSPVFLFSSKDGYGKEELLSHILTSDL